MSANDSDSLGQIRAWMLRIPCNTAYAERLERTVNISDRFGGNRHVQSKKP
jgi:hypothetical protein